MAKKLNKLAPKKTAAAINAAAEKVHAPEKPKIVKVNFKVNATLHEKMKRYADEKGIPMTFQFVEAMTKYFADRDFS